MPARTQAPKEQALDALGAAGPIWFRLATVFRVDAWQVSALELTSGEKPPRWRPLHWMYEEATFLAEQTDGVTVRRWFEAEAVSVGDVTAALPPLQQNISREHRSSGQEHIYEALRWPSVVYDLGQWTGVNTQPPEPLIAEGAPSFHTHAKAASHFFGVDFGSGGLADRAFHFRVQDLAGRIASVVVGVTGMDVLIEGSAIEGAVVELASDIEGPTERVAGHDPVTVTFPQTGPPPPNAWVVLRRGSVWIDRKFLRTIYTTNADPGVEYEAEPGTEVQSLVAQGETSMIEFKSRLPVDKDRDYRLDIAGTVAAFANQEGGRLLVGVANNGSIEGVTVPRSLDDSQLAVINLIKDLVTPLVPFDVQTHDVDGRLVMMITVEQGPTPPYGVGPATPIYYVRRGATTFPASSDAVRQLARSRPPLEQQSSLGYRRR